MYIASLIAAPSQLDPSLPDALRNALGGGQITWLSDATAAEFPLSIRPDHAAKLQQDCQAQGVDLNIVPAENRRKQLLIADMDSTMIQQECIDELAIAAGVGDQVLGVTARAMNGELDFEEALIARVGLLKDQPEGLIHEVLQTRITYMPGGATLLATMKANRAYAALVSGGFTAFTASVTETLGFDEHRANTLLAQGGTLTGDVARPILGRDAKVTALNEITARLAITPTDAIAVGDGANDLGMLSAAGMGVAAHAKPSVQAQADIVINHGDLTALLYLQGYTEADFQTP